MLPTADAAAGVRALAGADDAADGTTGADDGAKAEAAVDVDVDEVAEAVDVFVLLHPAKAAATVTATTPPMIDGEIRALI